MIKQTWRVGAPGTWLGTSFKNQSVGHQGLVCGFGFRDVVSMLDFFLAAHVALGEVWGGTLKSNSSRTVLKTKFNSFIHTRLHSAIHDVIERGFSTH